MAIEGYKQYRNVSQEAQKINQMQTIMDKATVFNFPFLQNSVLLERLMAHSEEQKENKELLKELVEVFEALKESEKKGA